MKKDERDEALSDIGSALEAQDDDNLTALLNVNRNVIEVAYQLTRLADQGEAKVNPAANLMPEIEEFVEVLNGKIPPDENLVGIQDCGKILLPFDINEIREVQSLLAKIRGQNKEYLKCQNCGLIAVDPDTLRCTECDADHRGEK